MTVLVEYRAVPVAGGVRLDREVRVGGDGASGWRLESSVSVVLTRGHALAMVEAYHGGRDGRYPDTGGGGRGLLLEAALRETYSLVWNQDDDEWTEDCLWSDWPLSFMDEVESAAEEAAE